MYCKNCGAEMREGSKFCPSCGGSQDAAPGNTRTRETEPAGNGTPYCGEGNSAGPVREDGRAFYGPGTYAAPVSATPGFVCSLVGLIVFPVVLGIIGLVLSNRALNSGCDNEGLARAGKVIGIIDICWTGLIILIVLLASCSAASTAVYF